LLDHTFLPIVDASLAELILPQNVEAEGAWSKHIRRTYQSEDQLGTGSGPFVDVVDARWEGKLICPVDCGVIGFLATATHIYWAKASPLASTLPIALSLTAYAGATAGGATFGATFAGAGLPAVPVPSTTDLVDACHLGPGRFATGRVALFAEAASAAVYVVVLPRPILKVGRNHLWRLRDELSSRLPTALQQLFTRGRSGTIPRENRLDEARAR
jgi:hypothetical protein